MNSRSFSALQRVASPCLPCSHTRITTACGHSCAVRCCYVYIPVEMTTSQSLRTVYYTGFIGDGLEIARQAVIEKALIDPEVLFFMNDLEGVYLAEWTRSDEHAD